MNSVLNCKNVWFHSLGCRTNQSETESLAAAFVDKGAVICDSPDGCDVAVIMTCSVTSMADKKSRQHIRMARHRLHSGALVVVCGCWAQHATLNEMEQTGIDIIVGNRQKSKLIGLVESALNGQPYERVNVVDVWSPELGWDELPQLRPIRRRRAFVKVQDGCNHFCSYCLVPFLRGRPVSRPIRDIADEVKAVAKSGCSEVILTGTNLGEYDDPDGAGKLASLLRELARLPVSIQFGSIEPFAFDNALLLEIASLPNFVPPLHIPLQSGDDDVLLRMKRGYTSAEYATKVKQIRDALGPVPISTDLLVGFPGEKETNFQNSLGFVRSVGFSKVHVFPFSPRSGTAAAAFSEQLPRDIILERARVAIEIFSSNDSRN